MELFDPYSHAIVSLAAVALISLLQNLHVGLRRGKEGLAPDAKIPDSYDSAFFRIYRTYANGTEAHPVFAITVIAAILAGASAFWVNLLASLFLLLRLGYWWVYVSGTGKPHAGLRSFVFIAGWAVNLLLALIAIIAGLT